MPSAWDEEYNGISRTECIRGMNQGTADSRASYIAQIGDLGASVMTVLGLSDEVAKMAKDASPKVQVQAVIAIGKMGGGAKDYLMEVMTCLSSPNDTVKIAACKTLGTMKDSASPAVSQVQRLIVSSEEDVSLAAIEASGKIKAADCVSDLVKLLGSKVSKIAAAAAIALGQLGDSEQVFPEMSKLLDSQAPEKRRAALSVVASSGSAATKFSAEIIKCLGDSDPVVRELAAGIFGKLGDAAKPMLEGAAKKLDGQEGAAKCAAAMALGSTGTMAASYAPKLAALLTDDFEDKASEELYTLPRCVIPRPPVAMRFTACAGAKALSMIGDAGTEYTKEISKLLSSNCWEARMSACEALSDMGKAGAALEPAVMELFSDKEVYVASAALVATGKMGAAVGGSSKEAVEKVGTYLTYWHPIVRTHAVKALTYMGSEVVGLLPKLLKCFEDRCPKVKVNAMEAIAKCGDAGTVLSPKIASMLEDENRLVRAGACKALGEMGSNSADFVDDVIWRLEDDDDMVRYEAVKAAGLIGAAARGWLEAVESMKQDSSEMVQLAASEAAEMIVSAKPLEDTA